MKVHGFATPSALLAILLQCGAVLAGQRPVALGSGRGAGADAGSGSWSDAADSPHSRCPYDFGSEMPSGSFCVYTGVAFGSKGEVCATDVVVIWNSFRSPSRESVASTQDTSGANRQVYLGFVADPELILWADVDSPGGESAAMTGYTLGLDDPPQPLSGRTTLLAVRHGTPAAVDMLNVELRKPRRFRGAGCAFAGYTGTFVGVLKPSGQSAGWPPQGEQHDSVTARRMVGR